MTSVAASALIIRRGVPFGGDGSASVDVVDGRIVDHDPKRSATRDTVTIDADGLMVAPGFIDLQVNGGHGIDLATDPEAMWDLARLLPRYGVTSFLPTIISSPPAITDRALAAHTDRPVDHQGAEPLGLHFEGPMLNPERAGAHDPMHLVSSDPELVARWSRAGGVALVTLAPELPGAVEVIERLRAGDVIVSAGHSTATSSEAAAGFDAGIAMVTHLFNAMGPMGHRSPGLIGAALANERIAVGLIVDGVHVDPVAVKVAWRAKGPERVVLVTDAVAAQGLGPGRHRLGDRLILADETSVRMVDGTLAGSVLTMNRAVANIVAFTGCSLADAVAAASTTPAAVIGATDRGHLRPGAVADVVLLDPDGSVAVTICRGLLAHVATQATERVVDIR